MPGLTKSLADATIRRVLVVSKPHLDVGFTESAAKVLHDNINWELHEAIGVARRLRDRAGVKFTWTVPAYIICQALERKSGRQLAEIEAGIADGMLAWHALPFTMHSELLDPALLEFALSLSGGLDKRFGTHTIAAKMTDVPGHTRGLVPVLAAAGVRFLHIGVNHVCAVPDVPPVCRWRDPETGSEIVLAICRGYTADVLLPQSPDRLVFRGVGDNMEVPSDADVLAWHKELCELHPAADVHWATLSDFARTFTSEQIAALPVFEGELGDTWIHGAGSDPLKVAGYRALLRKRRDWLVFQKLIPQSKAYVDFSTNLCLVAEHTWGLSIGPHLHDTASQSNMDFHRQRKRAGYRFCETSWQEQRDYLELAVEALDSEDLRNEGSAALSSVRAVRPDLRGWESCKPGEAIGFGSWELKVDEQSAALASAVFAGRELVAAGLGTLKYQTLSLADYLQCVQRYCGVAPESAPDIGRPGLKAEHAQSRWWPAVLLGLWRREAPGSLELLSHVTFEAPAHVQYGAPEEAFIRYQFAAERSQLDVEIQWFGKTATRLPEAMWIGFSPAVANPEAWQLHKLGRWINPDEVAPRGNRKLHAVQSGVRLEQPGQKITIETLDAPLATIGEAGGVLFGAGPGDGITGVHFNLHNNIWSTNFPLWYEDDGRFRFHLSFE